MIVIYLINNDSYIEIPKLENNLFDIIYINSENILEELF
jgi:hypothetical protein